MDTGRILTVGARKVFIPRSQPYLDLGKIVGYEDGLFGLKRKTFYTFMQFTTLAAKATMVRFVEGKVFY